MKNFAKLGINENIDDKNIKMRILFINILIFFSVFTTNAQREKNNIYLFDCTGSMITNKLWEPAKNSLDETLKLDGSIPGSFVTVIPFGDQPYEIFSFPAEDYSSKKGKIFDSFDKYVKEAKYTHISDVVEKGLQFIDPNKDNRIYLLTDGQPNHNDSPDKVAQTIARWCSNHKNSRFFYVALTKGALDEKIRKALEECRDAYIVEIEGNVIPQFADLYPSNIYTNLQELDQLRDIEFNLPGTYQVTSQTQDSLFNVRIKDNKAVNGKISIYLEPKLPITDLHQTLQGREYEFPVNITTVDKKYHIVNPRVTVHVSDEIPSELSLTAGEESITSPGVKWYDSFLWAPAASDKVVTWDLTPVFENSLQNSALKVKFKVPEGLENDVNAWYNEKPIKDGEILTISPDKPALLSLKFNHHSKTGKHYFELIPEDHSGLDLINGQPADEYEGTSLRTEYSIGWNPLAIVFFWIGIAIIVFLILWFLFLQRLFYPRIKMGKVEFTGPGTYYQSKKIKGARKVILTSKKKKQNIFSRLFTGEIRYVKADHFYPEIILSPSGSKKKVKITNTGKASESWEIFPSAIFNQYDKGTLKNKATNEETGIEFS